MEGSSGSPLSVAGAVFRSRGRRRARRPGSACRRGACTPALLLGALLGLAAALPASAGGVRIAGPALVLEPPAHDFGTVLQDAVYHTDVRLRNQGTSPLRITKVTTDCGCTVAEIPDSTLAPGAETVLKISFATRTFSGQVRKTIFIETNDPGLPRATLAITAFVRPAIRLDPGEIDFGNVPCGQTAVRTLTLRSAARDKLQITSVQCPEGLVTAEVRESLEGDTLVHQVQFRLRPDAPAGSFRKSAQLDLNHPQTHRVRVKLTGQVHGFFLPDATSISFGQLKQGVTRTRQLRLTATAPGIHRVQSAVCNDAGVGVEVQPLEGGRDFAVRLTLPPDRPPGPVKARLTIMTDDPLQPRIEIPVLGRVRSLTGGDEPDTFEDEDSEEEQP